MAVFDQETNLWHSSIDQQPVNEVEKSPSQLILDAITSHGSKLAQVFLIGRGSESISLFFTNFALSFRSSVF